MLPSYSRCGGELEHVDLYWALWRGSDAFSWLWRRGSWRRGAGANGTRVFKARVEPSMKTLLKWAAADNDRTMLYHAEIQIKLTR